MLLYIYIFGAFGVLGFIRFDLATKPCCIELWNPFAMISILRIFENPTIKEYNLQILDNFFRTVRNHRTPNIYLDNWSGLPYQPSSYNPTRVPRERLHLWSQGSELFGMSDPSYRDLKDSKLLSWTFVIWIIWSKPRL